MPRLFFAVPVPRELEDDLLLLEGGIPDARWTFGVGLHLTLAFLGDCNRHQEKEARQIAASIQFESFDLQIAGLGLFPLRGQPRVLWAGVQRSTALIDLQRILTQRLRRHGFELEHRKYHPHITLARVSHASSSRVRTWLQSHVSFGPKTMQVESFELVESQLTSRGPHYSIVEAFEAIV